MRHNLRSFRFSGRLSKDGHALAARLLRDEGFVFEPLPFYAKAMRLIHEPKPLGLSLAAHFGYIYIQDASSMLPALSLLAISRPGRDKNICVLDMCASPGGKSSLAANELASGFVLANEPAPKRLNTLRRNLQNLNMFNCAVSSYDAACFPLNDFPGWDYILLDPPCSGWGTADKAPRTLRLWRGDKLQPLIRLQRKLLAEAWRLIKPGGSLIYSTCTTNVPENEEQILHALDFTRGQARLLPLPAPEGFEFDEPCLNLGGVLRVAQTSPLGQGFFIAALQKSASSEAFPEQAPIMPGLAASGAQAKQTLPGGEIAPEDLETPLVNTGLLPPGRILPQEGKLLFYPEAGLELLPEPFKYSGFCLGGESKAGGAPKIPDTGLRGLMPEPREALEKGAHILNMEDIAEVKKLLGGQSLNIGENSRLLKEVGLYYKDLPLCRLKVKGKRLVM
jgi:16S rRNA (cytosine1407-C5)-methyltransferase